MKDPTRDDDERDAYPKPTDRPGRPSDAARALERERADASTSAQPTTVRCLYADDDVFVVDKPALAYVDDVLDAVRRGLAVVDADTVDAREETREKRLEEVALSMMHRLDRDTSGCLIFARSQSARSSLAEQFSSGTVKKSYVALCAAERGGHFETGGEFRVVSGHGRAKFGLFRLYELGDVDRSLPGSSSNKVKRCETVVTIGETIDDVSVRYCEDDDDSKTQLVVATCSPITGRTHQIRLHCASLGIPLVGDVRYGGPATLVSSETPVRGALLHAKSITFRHPTRGEFVTAVAPNPAWQPRTSARDITCALPS